MKVARIGARVGRFRRRYGLRALPRHVFRAVWRRLFLDKNHVFDCKGVSASSADPPRLEIVRVSREPGLSEACIDQLTAAEGEELLPIVRREFANHAELWLGFLNGTIVGYQWSRRGRHFDNWFVPLADDDVVIFNTVTFPAFRGRGISPAMMRHIMRQTLSGNARAYVDCKIWNASAIRGIQKAGFQRIVTMRPIREGRSILTGK